MKQTITLKRFNGTDYTTVLPKTVVEQLVDWNNHSNEADIHITEEQRSALKTFAVLTDEGYAPTSSTDNRIVKEYANYTEMVNTNKDANVSIMVLDASDDITVDYGWAIYIGHTKEEGLEYFKVADAAMMDMTFDFSSVTGNAKTKEEIDDMVEKDHSHENINLLNSLIDETFRRNQILPKVYTKETASLEELTAKVGDMVFVK